MENTLTNQKLLDYADTLAKLANLRPEDVEDFKKQYPHFVPDDWFTTERPMPFGPLMAPPNFWKTYQQVLKRAWEKPKFPFALQVWLMRTASERDRMEMDVAVGVYSLGGAAAEFEAVVYPFQQAVAFVSQQSWQAKRCAMDGCGKHFIAGSEIAKYCSTKCAEEAIRKSHSKSWHKHEHKWRPKRQKSKRR